LIAKAWSAVRPSRAIHRPGHESTADYLPGIRHRPRGRCARRGEPPPL